MNSSISWFRGGMLLAALAVVSMPASAEICFSQNDITIDKDPLTPPFPSNRIVFTMPREGTLVVTTEVSANTVPLGTRNFLQIVSAAGVNIDVRDLSNFVGTSNTIPDVVAAGATVMIEHEIGAFTGSATFNVSIDVAEGCKSTIPFVVEDFEDPSGGGVGWNPGSDWSGNLSYLTENAIEPRSPQHARSTGTAAFRLLSLETVDTLAIADEIWLGFLARFDRNKETGSFAGVSLFSNDSERFFIGGGFSTTQWVSNNGVEESTGEETSSEWTHVLVQFNFAGGQVVIYLDGTSVQFRNDLPARGWNRVRIAAGSFTGHSRISVDNLRIGETREAVESPLPARLYSANFASYRERNYGRDRKTTTLLYGTLPTFTPRENSIRGMAADDRGRAFTGHSNLGLVIAHDRAGNELFSWAAPATLQSMAMVDDELAIGSDDGISIHDPDTGVVNRTLPDPCASGLAPTGLAYDGTVLWAMCDATIESVDPITGASLGSITNVAFNAPGCPFGLQSAGLAATAPGELTIGCNSDGVATPISGWRVRSTDGSIIDTTAQSLGNALAAIPAIPSPFIFADGFESD